MRVRNFTPEDYPAIVDIHNSLNIVWPERPRTPSAWAEADRNRNQNCNFQRWVAVEDGQVVGFSSYAQTPWDYPPQSYTVSVEVYSQYQHCGIGSALYNQVIASLQAFDPPALRADAYQNLPQGFSFLQKRGFYQAFCETPVHLDVLSFDLQPYAGLEAELKARGVVIKTLRELKSDPDRDRKIYDLYWDVAKDVPQEGDPINRPEFTAWLAWGVNDPSILQDAYFIALQGQDYIGLRELGSYPDSDMLLGSLLGVRQEYRNRSIGLALQLRGIAFARKHGYRLLKTCTAVQNTPMQALFNKLGYTRDPEWQQCQKDLKS